MKDLWYEGRPVFCVAVGLTGLYLTNGSALASLFCVALFGTAALIALLRVEYRLFK